MNLTFIFLALFGISVTTNLTVEGIKKLLDTKNANYSSNVIAVVVSTIISIVSVVLYCIYFSESEPLCHKYGCRYQNGYYNNAHEIFGEQSESRYTDTFHDNADYELTESSQQYLP